MKNMFKAAALISTMGLIGVGIYLFNDKDLKKKAGNKVLNTMDNVEDAIAKKIN